MSLELLVPIATFVGIGALVWLALETVAGRKNRTEDRLAMLSVPRRSQEPSRDEKKSDAIARVLSKAAPSWAAPLTPQNERERDRLRNDLTEAGFRSELAPMFYTAIRSASAIACVIIGGSGSVLVNGFQHKTLVYTLAIGGAGLMLPAMVLRFLGKQRKQQIFLGLPDALDLMVVCVESGLGLDLAMRKVSEEMKKSHTTIASEFSLCNFQLQMGRSRNQVLQDLGRRTGVDELRALASILIQADKFGSSISAALRVQSDAMRVRRQQIAEEKAAKTAVKLIFPLVLFIFPGIFVVLVGPAAIQMARDLFTAM